MPTATKKTTSDHPWRRALLWGVGLTLVARLLALGFGFLLWQAEEVPLGPEREDQLYLGSEPMVGPLSGWTLGVWQRHDTMHYIEIAQDGYEVNRHNIVFPPLYPMLIRAGTAVGLDPLVASLLIATIATALALAVLYRMTEDILGIIGAQHTVIYQVVIPFGYILIAGYAEPLMLLLTVLALYLARRNHWALAGLSAFLATMTRSHAAALALPLLAVAWRRFDHRPWRSIGAWWAVAAGPLALVAYQAYLISSGLPTVYEVYRDRWRSVGALPGYDAWLSVRQLVTDGLPAARMMALVALVVVVTLTVVAFRKLPVEFGLYSLAMLLVVLSRHDQAGRPLLSFARQAIVIFPSWMALAAWVRSRPAHLIITYGALILNLLLMSAFFMWGFAE